MCFAEGGVNFGPGELVVVGSLLGAVVAALVFIFKLLLAQQAAQLADQKATAENYKSVAADAVRIMQTAMNKARELSGEPPAKHLAPVVPEHQSPISEAEQTTADQATLRAAVAAAALELGVPGRLNGVDGKPIVKVVPEDLVSKVSAVEAVLQLPSSPSPPAVPPEEKKPPEEKQP